MNNMWYNNLYNIPDIIQIIVERQSKQNHYSIGQRHGASKGDSMDLSKVKLELESCSELLVKNYPAMCDLLDEPKLAGDSKISQIDRWARFIRFERSGHKYIVTEVLETPEPEKTHGNDIYSDLVRGALSSHLAKDVLHSKFRLEWLSLCGFVNERFVNARRERWDYFREFSETHDCTVEQARFFYSQLSDNVDRYCSRVFDRCLGRLAKRGILSWRKRLCVQKEAKGEIVAATDSEIEMQEEAKRILAEENGITWVNEYTRDEYYYELNKKLKEMYGWTGTYIKYEITLHSALLGKDTDEDAYREARGRINELSVAQTRKCVESDIDKGAQRDFDELRDTMSEEDFETIELFFDYIDYARKLYGEKSMDRAAELKGALLEDIVLIPGNCYNEVCDASNEKIDALSGSPEADSEQTETNNNEGERAFETLQPLDPIAPVRVREEVGHDRELDDLTHEEQAEAIEMYHNPPSYNRIRDRFRLRYGSVDKQSMEALEKAWLDEEHKLLGLKLSERLREDKRLLALIVEHTRCSEEDWLEHAAEVGVEVDSLLGLCLFDESYEMTPIWVYEEKRIPHVEGHETYWSYIAAMTRYYEQFLELEEQRARSGSR